MRAIFNKIISLYLERRYRQMEYFMEHPLSVQNQVLHELLAKGKRTKYGERYQFSSITSSDDYSKKVPLVDYEDIRGEVKSMMDGEASVLWPGVIKWYSKSSGTTSDKSKFIPVSDENLKNAHIKSSWDVVATLYKIRPESKIFAEKNLVMGGSLGTYEGNPATRYGDISAVMLENMPVVGRPFYTPDIETALLSDWNEKLERMVERCSSENVVMFGGVPTWVIVLFNKILEYTGKNNMLEVWPDLQAYMHGGVGFGPYREQFKKYIPSDQFTYLEVYNASEGYFGVQNDLATDDMLLLLDNGVYYEFIPMSVWGTDKQYAVPLEGVEIGENYAIVISTNSGLWRYQPGDTVTFTSTYPYKIKITGRTKHFINVFGEELMVGNTDAALSKVCNAFDVETLEYTAAPIFMEGDKKGGHEWVIEFNKLPKDINQFKHELDKAIQQENSDYEAKRTDNLALEELTLHVAPKGTFVKWMESRGKSGGQHKVPRLSNTRQYIDEILKLL